MQIPHNAYVLVADGRKLLFFRNEGDADYPKLEVEMEREQENPKDSDQGTDQPADMLKKKALANAFDKLIVVAPPKTLGELRKHYHKEVEARIAGEVAKDLTNMPVAEIEKILQAQ
jgi:protein required for attachment to host cells